MFTRFKKAALFFSQESVNFVLVSSRLNTDYQENSLIFIFACYSQVHIYNSVTFFYMNFLLSILL